MTSPAGAPSRALVRRGGWALPPLPPEQWVGAGWALLLLAGLALAVGVPAGVLLQDDEASPLVVGGAALGAVASAVTAYLLLVQGSVTGDPRLRWVAGGYATGVVAAVGVATLVRGERGDLALDPGQLDAGAALLVVGQLAIPLLVLTSGLAARSLPLVALPVGLLLGLAAAAVLAPESLPDLVGADGARSGLLRGLDLGLVAVTVGAALAWGRTVPAGWRGPWGAVLVALVAGPASTAVLAVSDERYDAAWWTSAVIAMVGVAVPAAGLLLQGTHGYFRQSRRWHQLEAEVRALRTATALLPGRSITPEDEAGLPEAEDVRQLVEQRRVKIALQPVVELSSGAVVGHEALSRFGGRTPTDRWFRAASRHGYGGELEQITLKAALALLERLPAPGYLAVNVSPAALSDPVVVQMLHDSDLPRIVVEITEHEAVADYPVARATLDALRARGARIAVDDTGAGFASLRHVLLLQPDVIKLDSSITRDVETDERQRALVVAIMSFAKEVGSEVLAEGVETEEQLRALLEIGVPVGQGWHLGLPVVQED